jgi:ribose transport system substrate-binding protein
MRVWWRSWQVALAGLLVLGVAACGSGGDESSKAAAADNPAVAKAEAATRRATGKQTQWNGPTSGPKAATGKHVVVVSCDQTNQVCKAWASAVESAGQEVGWKVTTIDGQGTPTGWQGAINQATALKPDGIVLAGVDAQAEHNPVTTAAQRGIKIVGMHATAAPGPQPQAHVFMNIQQDPAAIARAEVDYVIAKSRGKANIITLYDAQYAIAVTKDKAMVAQARACRGCKLLSNVNAPIADVSRVTPSLVSGWVSRYPKPFYVVTVGDHFFDFMPAALRSGGVSPKDVLLVGADGTPPAYQRIRRGDFQIATVPEPAEFEGWIAVDELNRAFAGAPVADFTPPVYLVDKSNVDEQGGDRDVFDPANGYKQRYRRIWGK